MPFDIKPLSKDEKFFNDAEKTPTIVEGKGQMVYWMRSVVREYETGNTGTPLKSHKLCDGEGLAEKGLSLWFGGPSGLVKET